MDGNRRERWLSLSLVACLQKLLHGIGAVCHLGVVCGFCSSGCSLSICFKGVLWGLIYNDPSATMKWQFFAWSLFFKYIKAFNEYTNCLCSVIFPTNLLIQALVSFLSSSVVWGWHNCPPRAPLGEHWAKLLPPPGELRQWIQFICVQRKCWSVQMGKIYIWISDYFQIFRPISQ